MKQGEIYLHYFNGACRVYLITKTTNTSFYYIQPDGTCGMRSKDAYKRMQLAKAFPTWQQALKSKLMKFNGVFYENRKTEF